MESLIKEIEDIADDNQQQSKSPSPNQDIGTPVNVSTPQKTVASTQANTT
jgi:hypothetical protein